MGSFGQKPGDVKINYEEPDISVNSTWIHGSCCDWPCSCIEYNDVNSSVHCSFEQDLLLCRRSTYNQTSDDCLSLLLLTMYVYNLWPDMLS